MTPRILIAGFHHETNTFANAPADWAAFTAKATYPALSDPATMLDALLPLGLPASGFIAAARGFGWTLLPSLWVGATPSAHITQDAFERIAGAIVQAAADQKPDAIYLDLHGAAVAEHVDDCEGELLARLRRVAGDDVPIVVSLDFHANVTEQMLALADALTGFRTYPHVDMVQTGARAAQALATRLQTGQRLYMSRVRLPFLIALNAQCTDLEPAASLFETLHALAGRLKLQLEFTPGFPAADIAECGPVVWAYGANALATHSAVMALANQVTRHKPAWQLQTLEPAQAATLAIEQAARIDKPVLLADTQDNPGAGGEANTTGLIHALLKAGAGLCYPQRVAAGLLFDPAAAQAACKAGAGKTIHVSLGASVRTFAGGQTEPPISGPFTVRSISDGNAIRVGPMGRGSAIVAGPAACLEKDGILFAVASIKMQALDRSLFTMVGIEPAQMKIIALKSSVHFRADFAPIASEIHVVKAAGPVACDPKDLAWQKLPAEMLN